MALPNKASRPIEVDGVVYRWMVRSHEGWLGLTVQRAKGAGQVLQVTCSPHRTYVPGEAGGWVRVGQGRRITPKLVAQVVRHGLTNGWQPRESGPGLALHLWDADLPDLPMIEGPGVPVVEIARAQVADLRFDVGLDPHWRRHLVDAEVHERFVLPEDYAALGPPSREHGLRYAVFNDGWTDEGMVVFGIASVEFPHVVMYTTNSPGWPPRDHHDV